MERNKTLGNIIRESQMPDQLTESVKKLQTARDSKVILYFLSNRRSPVPIPGINATFASEPQLLIYDHLKKLGHVPKLDMVIHTAGGDLNAVWPIVNICREMTDHFTVIVPIMALSAGTLLCLGADEVLMCTPACLSPIDPTTANQFNPEDKRGQPMGISVEDVTSYLKLVRDKEKGTGITKEENITRLIEQLTNRVHPLALGNVNRVHTQVRALAYKLLKLNESKFDNQEHIDRIVKVLTEELQSHSHQIGVSEATKIFGNNFIKRPAAELENTISDLFECCATKFKIRNTFNVKDWMGRETQKNLKAVGAMLMSENLTHYFIVESIIRQLPELPPQVQIQIPPGQQMPLLPGLPTRIGIEPIKEGWYNIPQDQDGWTDAI